MQPLHLHLAAPAPVGAPVIDTTKLLAHLRAKADHRDPVIHAIYTGLADRVRRGDFDTDQKDQT